MMLKNYLFLFAILFSFLACNQQPKPKSDTPQSTTEIPELLDRPEALWHGAEWQDIQNRYAAKRAKVQSNPNDLEAYLELALVFINEARITGEHGHYYPAALDMLHTALSAEAIENDLKFRALATKAGVLLSLHQFSEALSTGQQALALNPYNAQVLGAMVDAYVETGDYSSAIDMADRMVSIRPDLRSYSRISYLREIHGDVPGAIEAMEMAVQSGHPALEETAWAMLTLGHLYEQYDDPNKALTVYKTILEHRPNHPFAIAAIGNIYRQEKQYDKAEQQLQMAMDIIPEVGFYMDMTRLYKATNREQEAIQMTDEILVMLKEDTDSGHNMNLELAEVYAEFKGDYNTALQYALEEHAKRPKNIDVNRRLALLYSDMGEWKKASEYAAAASTTNSKHPDLLALSREISLR